MPGAGRQNIAPRLQFHVRHILEEEPLLGFAHVPVPDLVQVEMDLVLVSVAEGVPQKLDQWVGEKSQTLLLTVFVENLKVVQPDLGRVLAHYSPGRWHQLLFPCNPVRAEEH